MWSFLLYGVSSFFFSHLATPLGGHPTLICKEFPHFLWLSILLCDYTVVQLTILQSLGILITSELLRCTQCGSRYPVCILDVHQGACTSGWVRRPRALRLSQLWWHCPSHRHCPILGGECLTLSPLSIRRLSSISCVQNHLYISFCQFIFFARLS